MRLEFKKLTCTRCGGERLAKAACPECSAGPAPHETQPDLERRTRIVADFRSRRREAIPNRFPEDLAIDCGEALQSVVRALAGAARGECNADDLVVAFERLDQLVADTSLLRLRPELNRGRREHQACVTLRSGLEKSLDALTAPTMLQAQKLASEGRRHIDQCVTALGETNRHETLSGVAQERNLAEVLGADHSELVGDSDFRSMGGRLGSILGLPGADVAFHYAIESIDVTATCLDQARVLEISQIVEGLLSASRTALEDRSFQLDLVAASLIVESRSDQLLRSATSDESNFVVVQNALDLAAAIRERGLKTVVALLLAAEGVVPYGKSSTWPPGKVLKTGADSLRPRLGLSTLDRSLRDAVAHQDFSTDGDWVMLDRGNTRLTADEFLDRVLAALEVHQGILRGIFLAMSSAGIQLPAVTELPPRLRLEIIRYFLALNGVQEVHIAYDGSVARLNGQGKCTNWPATAAGITTVLPDGIDKLEIRLRVGDELVHGTAELAAYRDWHSEHDITIDDASLFQFLNVCAATRLDGHNPLPAEVWANSALHVSAQRDDDSLAARVRRVMKVRDLARAADVPTDAIEGLLKRLRSTGTYEGPVRSDHRRSRDNLSFRSPNRPDPQAPGEGVLRPTSD